MYKSKIDFVQVPILSQNEHASLYLNLFFMLFTEIRSSTFSRYIRSSAHLACGKMLMLLSSTKFFLLSSKQSWPEWILNSSGHEKEGPPTLFLAEVMVSLPALGDFPIFSAVAVDSLWDGISLRRCVRAMLELSDHLEVWDCSHSTMGYKLLFNADFTGGSVFK